jgi:hypothetical protein
MDHLGGLVDLEEPELAAARDVEEDPGGTVDRVLEELAGDGGGCRLGRLGRFPAVAALIGRSGSRQSPASSSANSGANSGAKTPPMGPKARTTGLSTEDFIRFHFTGFRLRPTISSKF